MNLLLDTHTFIWWSCNPEKLPADLINLIKNPANALFLSTASTWEVQIKIGIGKLSFTEDWEKIVSREIENNFIQIVPISLEHTFALKKLPPVHKDPFDRMLIAQGLTENFTIATNDSFIKQYPDIQTVWK